MAMLEFNIFLSINVFLKGTKIIWLFFNFSSIFKVVKSASGKVLLKRIFLKVSSFSIINFPLIFVAPDISISINELFLFILVFKSFCWKAKKPAILVVENKIVDNVIKIFLILVILIYNSKRIKKKKKKKNLGKVLFFNIIKMHWSIAVFLDRGKSVLALPVMVVVFMLDLINPSLDDKCHRDELIKLRWNAVNSMS